MKRGFTLLELILTITAIAVVFLIERGVYDWGKYAGRNELRAEAVKMDVARWTVTDENGKTEFRWNSPKAANACMDTNNVLAYMRATNEFGGLEVRWTPPVKSVSTNESVSTNSVDLGSPNYPWKNPILPPAPHGEYILKLRDAKTGKEVDVLIPAYTNATQLLNAPCSR